MAIASAERCFEPPCPVNTNATATLASHVSSTLMRATSGVGVQISQSCHAKPCHHKIFGYYISFLSLQRIWPARPTFLLSMPSADAHTRVVLRVQTGRQMKRIRYCCSSAINVGKEWGTDLECGEREARVIVLT